MSALPGASFDGQKFGRLTVLHDVEHRRLPYGKSIRMVLARCDCGAEKVYQLGNVKSGNSWSCGCYDVETLRARNAERAIPQKWNVEGDIAWLEVSWKRATIDAADVAIAEKYRWHVTRELFACAAERSTLHRILLGLSNGDKREGDHKNHDTLDNRRSCNIRIATSSQNKMNRRGNKSRRGPFKGVSFEPDRNKFKAQIKINGKQTFIGRFVSEINAAQAYNILAETHFGEFAYLNKARAA